MELIDIYDDLGQKCSKSEDRDEVHRKALIKEVSYVSMEEFKKMVELNSPRLMPYETHYQFLLITLNSRLMRQSL